MNEYQIARTLLDELTAVLPLTRAGQVGKAFVHPGSLTPAYGCSQAWTRIVSIAPTVQFPAPASLPSRCTETESAVTVEVGVYRCYARPADNLDLPPGHIDSQARDVLDDANAMKLAVRKAFNAQMVVQGIWTPRGPDGDVHGGQMMVTVRGDGQCGDGFVSIDDVVDRLPGDPRV